MRLSPDCGAEVSGPVEAPSRSSRRCLRRPPITPNATVVEFPIVRVNDQIIDNSDYQRAQAAVGRRGPARQREPRADLAQQQKDLLRDMIDQQLLLSRGKELEINADAEVIRRLDDIRKQNHLDTMEELEKAVRESGISFEDFKANIKNEHHSAGSGARRGRP